MEVAERFASPRAALRAATEATHLRMHALPPFVALEAGALDWAAYRRLVRNLYSFHGTLCERLEGLVAPELWTGPRRRELLRRDLEFLAVPSAPDVMDWPSPDGAHARLGCLYAAQGSALGGRLLGRQLDRLFGDGKDGRLFFLGEEADRTAWRRLCKAIDKAGGAPRALGQMIEGAEATFRLFETCVAPLLSARAADPACA